MKNLTINQEIALDIIKSLTGKKLERLIATLDRNCALTSTWDLSHGEITIYKQGWYLELTGTRCRFSVFAFDNDGEIEIADRKPHENKLNRLYSESLTFMNLEIEQIANNLKATM